MNVRIAQTGNCYIQMIGQCRQVTMFHVHVRRVLTGNCHMYGIPGQCKQVIVVNDCQDSVVKQRCNTDIVAVHLVICTQSDGM